MPADTGRTVDCRDDGRTLDQHYGSAEEDLACAQYIAALLTADDVDPHPFIERALHSTAARQLTEGVDKGFRLD
ncbi:hypothetical protein [Nocardia beijingensis]|uniref:Uncharacterized protein n=1 Tax=Nocardia beijingensis TaxID=95162 RepID=A0ABW7WSN2_9NOCA